jgi:tight adherence protein C
VIVVASFSGALVGLGVWALWRALFPPPEPLPTLAARLAAPRNHGAGQGATSLAGAWLWVRRKAARDDLAADLAVCDRAPARHALDKLGAAVALAVMPVLFAGVAAAGGGAVPAAPLLVAASAALSVGGWYLADVLVRSEARRRRRDFRHALVAYVDLVTTVLAAGGGVETALTSAARVADTAPFRMLGAAVTRAQRIRTSPWEELRDLGATLGVRELEEVASSVALAGTNGARVRQSLGAKAVALRERLLSDERARAEASTERMAIPMVLLLLAFVGLVGYPAFVRVMSL